MSVYKKLQEARVKFHKLSLKKSGKNTFAGYNYFELGDFLPHVQEIFSELGLCGVVAFDKEIAWLKIVDVDKPEQCITISSPMGGAALKGCHEVQNIGAVETYQRRYLWGAAMEIVENDIIDASETNVAETKQVKAAKVEQPKQDALKVAVQHASKMDSVKVDPQKVIEAVRDMDAAIMKGDGDWVAVANLWFALPDVMKKAVWPKLEKPTQVFLTEEKAKRAS